MDVCFDVVALDQNLRFCSSNKPPTEVAAAATTTFGVFSVCGNASAALALHLVHIRSPEDI